MVRAVHVDSMQRSRGALACPVSCVVALVASTLSVRAQSLPTPPELELPSPPAVRVSGTFSVAADF
jgi:hypothetical protein